MCLNPSFSLCRSQNIKRIFFDECHELLVSLSFRRRWSAVHALVTCQLWQLVYLTATLPLLLESTWYERAGINPAITTIVRGPTNRKELGYHIIRVNPKERQRNSVLEQTVRMLEEKYTDPEARRIIFTHSIEDCNSLAEMLNCFKHHSEMSVSDRGTNLELWKDGVLESNDGSRRKETWIVATPGLITGYDYHRVDNIVFFEKGYGLLNVVQGGGRAGRDGKRGNVVVLTSDTWTTHDLFLTEDHQLQGKLTQWLEDKEECLRIIISDVMDGKAVTCADLEGCNPCGRCQPESEVSRLLHLAVSTAKTPEKAHIPMEDIQELLPTQSQSLASGQKWDDSMEDMDFDTDDIMASMDLDSTATSSTCVSATSSIDSLPSSNLTKSILAPASKVPSRSSSNLTQRSQAPALKPSPHLPRHGQSIPVLDLTMVKDVGMSIRVGAAENSNIQQIKKDKSAVLNTMATTLRDCCRTCWTWKNKLVREPGHKEFSDCWNKGFCNGKLAWGLGPGTFKSLVDLRKWHFCYNCGLPQDVDHVHYRPECHSVPGAGACEFKGLVYAILYTLHQCPPLWKVVKQQFRLGDNLDDVREFASWCATYNPATSNYWIGLEVVIWFWKERTKGRFVNIQ